MVLGGQREHHNTVTNLCVQTFHFLSSVQSSVLKSSACFPHYDYVCQLAPITQILADFTTADCHPGCGSLMLAFSSAAASECAHWGFTCLRQKILILKARNEKFG